MLELDPGEAFCQESSVVLLRGKLMATGRADTVPLQQLPGRLLALLTCCTVQHKCMALSGFLVRYFHQTAVVGNRSICV